MSLLDRVHWPAVYRQLTATASHATVRRLSTHDSAHARFAILVLAEHYCALRGAVCAAGLGDDPDRAELLSRWLQATAHLVLAQIIGEQDPPPAEPCSTGRLHLDPKLPELPLLDLATELAQLSGGCRVTARTLPPGGAGRFARRHIELDLEQAGDRLNQVWAHEVGHWLDGWPHDAEQRERYADELGALLLAEQPTCLAEAWPLCAKVHEQITTRPRFSSIHDADELPAAHDDLPAPGPASVQAFRSLPLDDQLAAA